MNENNFEKLNREMNFEKSNLKKNLEENMEKTNSGKEFEELNSTEQIVMLSEIKETIQQYFNDNNYNYEVVDITFNRLSTGKIIYEVECKDFATDERKNLLYTIDEENKIKEFEPIDIDKIKYLQEIGQLNANINYTELEEKAKIEEKEITELRERETKSVNGNINKRNNAISLNELINNQEKQIEELKDAGNKLGFDSRVVEEYVKFNGEKDLTEDDLKGFSSSDIKGTDKVSSKFTMNQILGMKYQNYKILKDIYGNALMVGQKPDGTYEIIDNNKYEVLPYATEISLVYGDGSIRTAQVDIGLRLKGLKEDNDQVIGIYRDNNKYGSFYARGYNSNEKMIGSEIETEPYVKSNVSKSQEIVDRRENKDIKNEQENIKEEEAPTTVENVYNVNNPDEYSTINYEIQEYRETLDNPEIFDTEFEKQLSYFSGNNSISEEEKKRRAFIVARNIIEQNREDDSEVEKEENNPEIEKEENNLKDDKSPNGEEMFRGTPWGNPTNNHY